MNEKLRDQIEYAGHEIYNWLQDAVGDLSMILNHSEDMLDSRWKKKVAQARLDGVQDLHGWLADEYFNDVPIIRDLCGDKIFDKTIELLSTYSHPQFAEVYDALCDELADVGHTALGEACKQLKGKHGKGAS